MTVPTNNLYDFIHLVTKRKFWLMYFSPWGSRDLNDLVEHSISDEYLNFNNTIPWELRQDKDLYSHDVCEMESLRHTQPVLLCYDQEPLMFDLYKKDFNIVQDLLVKRQLTPLSHATFDLNLRWPIPMSMQKYFILLHSELNSQEVKKYENTGMFKTAFWWSHALIARDWYRFAKFDLSLTIEKNIKNLFLVYCRDTSGYREYRKDFLTMINSNLLTNYCYIPSLSEKVSSNASANYVSDDFNSTAISIVLETLFDQRIHLTEKTLRPLACGHPFIVAAGPGTLSFLKKYGFKTFEPYINESYDSIKDNTQRLKAIVDEMSRISKLNESELNELLSNCQKIAEHNKKIFFSDEFQNLVIQELVTNVEQAYTSTGNQLDFENFWRVRQLYRKFSGKPVTKTGYRKESVYLLRQQRLANRAR